VWGDCSGMSSTLWLIVSLKDDHEWLWAETGKLIYTVSHLNFGTVS